MTDTSVRTQQRRALLLTGAVALIIVAGIVLFFVFGRFPLPLLSPGATTSVP